MRLPVRRAFMARVFHLLYHQFAWSYDAVSALVSRGRWQDWGATALPFLARHDILELGHGPGHLLLTMNRQGCRPVGIDLSPPMGRLAARRLRGSHIPVPLVRGRGQALPFAGASFDCVIAAFPAPYITAPETVAAVRRVLRPGGCFIIIPEAQLTGTGLTTQLIDWLFRATGQRGAPHLDGQADNGFWTQALGNEFSVTVHLVPRDGSIVTVIVAEQHEPNRNDF